MRTYGSGTIEPLSRGRFRGRLPGQKGKRLPIRPTRELAELDLHVAVRNTVDVAPAGTPLAVFGRRVLARRELDGYSNARRELSRWATHVERTPLGARAVQLLDRADVVEWMRGRLQAPVLAGHRAALRRPRTLARAVVVDALRILRAVVKVALDEQIIRADPTAGVRVPRDRGRTHEPWTYLRPAEVARLLGAADVATVEKDRGGVARKTNGPEAEVSEPLGPLSTRVTRAPFSAPIAREAMQTQPRGMTLSAGPAPTTARRTALVKLVHPEDADAARVAIYTGLREGELWCLHLEDVDLDAGRIVVRYGGRRGARLSPTKGRRPRTLHLLQPALEALRRQLARLADPARKNPRRLVFPSLSRGRPSYRAESRPPKCWQAWLAAAGLDRGRADPAPVTWHSLRHTFATLTMAGKLPGAEGEGWRIERVSAYLGHTSIAVTQRYADVAALL